MRAIFSRLGREGTAGAFIVVVGAIFWLIVRDYPRGELSEFGPGLVPWFASIVMLLLGAAMLVRALITPNYDAAPALGRPLFVIPLGMALFAFGLDTLGLFSASALGVFVTTFATQESSLKERVLAALALAGMVTLVFGYALSMTMPIWPVFLRA
jgi:ABC-type transport system involved in cytochrome c biogenesis permease subunit